MPNSEKFTGFANKQSTVRSIDELKRTVSPLLSRRAILYKEATRETYFYIYNPDSTATEDLVSGRYVASNLNDDGLWELQEVGQIPSSADGPTRTVKSDDGIAVSKEFPISDNSVTADAATVIKEIAVAEDVEFIMDVDLNSYVGSSYTTGFLQGRYIVNRASGGNVAITSINTPAVGARASSRVPSVTADTGSQKIKINARADGTNAIYVAGKVIITGQQGQVPDLADPA
jgi:hypothetical protein